MLSRYIRGMVYWATLPQTYGNSVQSGRRPCIIVSNNLGNAFSDILTVVPCTTNMDKADSQPTHFPIKLLNDTPSVALGENIQTISKKSCEAFIGVLDENSMKNIDKIIEVALGLTPVPEKESEKPKIEVKEEVKQTEEKVTSSKLLTTRQKKKYLEDYREYGTQYCITKYNLPSIAAAYQRYQKYKKAVDK